MDRLHNFYDWVIRHKEGLSILVAATSPFTSSIFALIAAGISYRATITGPRIQRQIAEKSLETSREQLRFQRQQAEATLYGAYNQRWVDKFSEKAAELITSASEIQTISGDRKATRKMSEEVVNMLLKSNRSYQITLNETKLLVNENDQSDEFFRSVSELLLIEGYDAEKINAAQTRSVVLARSIIQGRLLSVKGHLVDETRPSNHVL